MRYRVPASRREKMPSDSGLSLRLRRACGDTPFLRGIAGGRLATLPSISQISRYDIEHWGDYWRFTSASARRLFGDVFGIDNVEVDAFGNVLSACAFLYQLGSHELSREELDERHPDYELTVVVRAVKHSRG